MSRKTKIWLITAISLIVLGAALFCTAMAENGWDFTKLSTGKYKTTSHTVSEEFSSISIESGTADISLLPSEDGKCKVVCYDAENAKHAVNVTSGTLNIKLKDTRKWYEHIGIHFTSPKVTLYLPEAAYEKLTIRESTGDVEIPKDFQFQAMNISLSTGDVTTAASSAVIKIETSTGNISVADTTAETLQLSVSTGKTNLTDIRCKNLISQGDTGKIVLKNVVSTGKISIERDTGDIRFEGSDAAEIFVETDTGDVTGTLLSEKVFIARTDTGRIDVPETTNGGKCKITTDTGDIKIDIE